MDNRDRKPILITGSIRSGTTWVGKILGASHSVAVIIEPFNKLHRMGTFGYHWQYQYTYITEENEADIARTLQNTLNLKYDIWAQIKSIRCPRNVAGFIRDFVKFNYWRYISHPRVLLKDPIAIFSAPWLAKTFHMDVIVLIRHPAAFAWSYKRIREPNRFADFCAQKKLMNDLLYPFEKEIFEFQHNKHDLIDEAILMWRIVYSVVDKFRQEHPQWIFKRHEDFSLRPVEEFRDIFSRLGLNFSSRIQKAIQKTTNSSNPTEAPNGVLHSLRRNRRRNRRKNIMTWHKRLTAEEIRRIRNGTEDIAPLFYSDESWSISSKRKNII